MTGRDRGFLLAELATAVAVFAGVVLALALFFATAGDVVAMASQRVQAANRADEVLNEVKAGNIVVADRDTTEVDLAETGTPLPRAKCTVTVERWPKQSKLRRVTVTVSWDHAQSAKGSVSLETLVRAGRLKLGARKSKVTSERPGGEAAR